MNSAVCSEVRKTGAAGQGRYIHYIIRYVCSRNFDATHVLLCLEELLLAVLAHLVLELAQARDDLASLVAEEPGDVAELDGVVLAGTGCGCGGASRRVGQEGEQNAQQMLAIECTVRFVPAPLAC